MDLIELRLAAHPLKGGGARAALPGPMRLDALMRLAWPTGAPAAVWLDGEPAAQADWGRIEARPGQTVAIRPALAGGDTNPLRVVLQLALAAGTFGLVNSAWYAGAGAWAQAGAAAGLVVVGNLLINAVAPPRLPELSRPSSEPQYALAGGANRARPYEPLLMALGRRQVFPDLAGAGYTEFRGGDMHLSQLFSFGIGDLDISDLRIGGTPLEEYEEVRTELLRPGEEPTLVWADVDTARGAELDGTDPVVRQSSRGAARLAVDFAGQIFEVDKKGRYKARSVQVRVATARIGAGAAEDDPIDYPSVEWRGEWDSSSAYEEGDGVTAGGQAWVAVLAAPAGEAPAEGGGYWRRPALGDAASVTVTLRGRGPEAVRRSVELPLAEAGGQWQVTVTRLAAPSAGERVRDAVSWTALRTYQAAAGDASSSTRLAVDIRASGQLQGRLDRLSGVVHSRAPAWRGGAWTADAEATSNPAALLRLVARGIWHGGQLAGGAGLPAARVDDALLGAWHEFCDREGLRCDLVAQGRQSRAQLMRSILQCGRADLSWATGKLGVVWEDSADPVAGMVTPGSIIAGSVSIDWIGAAQLAQEFVARYADAAAGWREAEARRTMPGAGAPTRSAEVRLDGVTSARQAARETNMMAASQLHRRRSLKWRMGLEGLAVGRGERWWITHSLIDGGETGRLAGASAGLDEVELDRAVEVAGGSWLAVRLPDGRLHASRVATAPGEASTIALAEPLPSDPAAGSSEYADSLWRHYPASDPPARVRITAVRPAADGTVEITAADDPDAYYAADTADLSVGLLPRLRDAPAVESAIVTEEVERRGLGYTVLLTATLTVSGDWRGGAVLMAVDGGERRHAALIEDGAASASWPAPPSGTAEITIVPGSAAAPAGRAFTVTHTIAGLPVRPGAPSGLAAAAGVPGRSYSWTPPDDEAVVGFRLRYAPAADGRDFSSMDPMHEGLLTSSPWRDPGPAKGSWDFGLAAVDAAGLESAPAYARAVDLEAPPAAPRGIEDITRDDDTGIVTVEYSDGTTARFVLADGLAIKDITRDDDTGIVTVELSDGTVKMFAVEDGAPGGLSEWIYRSTDDEDDPAATPDTPVATDPDRLKTDDVPDGWADDPVEGVYTWVSKRSREVGTDPFGAYSAPTRWRGEVGAGGISVTGEETVIWTSGDGGQNWRTNVSPRGRDIVAGRSSMYFRRGEEFIGGIGVAFSHSGTKVTLEAENPNIAGAQALRDAVTHTIAGNGTASASLIATHTDTGLTATFTALTIVTGQPSAAPPTFELTASLRRVGAVSFQNAPYQVAEGGQYELHARLRRLTGSGSPSSPVTVSASESSADLSIVKPDPSQMTLDGTPFVFSVAEDTGSAVPEKATIALSATGGVTDTLAVTLTIIDNDYLDIEQDRLTVRAGGKVTIRARLRHNLPGEGDSRFFNAYITASEAVAELSISGAARRSYSSANWDDYQSWTIKADADADAGNYDVTLTFVGNAGGANVREEKTVRVTVTATQPLSPPPPPPPPPPLSPPPPPPPVAPQVSTFEIETDPDTAALRVNEGATATARARLKRTSGSAAPSGDTVITASESDADISIRAPAARTFTPSNWSDWQSWTVAGEHDQDSSDDRAQVTFTASGAVTGTATVDVDVTDDDSPPPAPPDAVAPSVAIQPVASGQEGTSTTLRPTISGGTYDNLSFAWSVTGGTLSSASARAPTWTRPTVTSATTVTITLAVTAAGTGAKAASGTSDTETDTETASVTDTPAPAVFIIELDKSSLTIEEGESGTVRGRLKRSGGSGNPSAATTITAAYPSSSDLSITAPAKNFPAAAWNTYQTWTITAGDDRDTDNDSAQVTFTAAGAVTDTEVLAVTITDDDELLPIDTPANFTAAFIYYPGDINEYFVIPETIVLTGSFDRPALNGAAFARYELQYRIGTAGSVETLAIDSYGDSATVSWSVIDGLSSSGGYQARVRAVATVTARSSGWSQWVTATDSRPK